MKWCVIVLCFGMLLILSQALADSVAEPYPKVFTSEDGKYFFKMIPRKAHWDEKKKEFVVDRKAFGVAYSLTKNGELKEMWRTSDWYCFEGYLSRDGRYFVRMGPWASDTINHTDLAIAFYDRGKLLKEYQVKDLVRRPELYQYSTTFYQWRSMSDNQPDGFVGETFKVTTIDGLRYSFSYDTGQTIIAENIREGDSTKQSEGRNLSKWEKRAIDIYKKSQFKKKFENQFTVSGMDVLPVSYVTRKQLIGDIWVANLKPKESVFFGDELLLKKEMEVGVVAPLTDAGELVIEVQPQQMMEAIRKAGNHPYVYKYIEEGAVELLRLRMYRDRLYWSPIELEQYLTVLSGKKPTKDEMSEWANFSLRTDGPKMRSIFVNVKTSELFYFDESQYPWKPILLDAKGEVVKRVR